MGAGNRQQEEETLDLASGDPRLAGETRLSKFESQISSRKLSKKGVDDSGDRRSWELEQSGRLPGGSIWNWTVEDRAVC